MTDLVTPERGLTLRSVGPGDLDELHALKSDYEVVKRTGTWPWPPDRTFTASRCKPVDPAEGFYAVIREGGNMIGYVGVKNGVLGYAIARDRWGKGYATEAVRTMIGHGFATWDWPRIEACVYDDNDASANVLLKLGFVEGPRCTGQSASRGGRWPTRTFSMSRPEPPAPT